MVIDCEATKMRIEFKKSEENQIESGKCTVLEGSLEYISDQLACMWHSVFNVQTRSGLSLTELSPRLVAAPHAESYRGSS